MGYVYGLSDKSIVAFAPMAPVLPTQSNTSTHQSSYMREKHISDMEAFRHDHVEEAMGYEHTVEGA